MLGSLDTHDNLARALASESGCAVLSVDYRLAPEHPPRRGSRMRSRRPPGRRNAAALGCDAGRLAIGGDSAGANLAAVVTQAGTLPYRFQLLVYPVTDARGGTASYEEHKVDRGSRSRDELVPRPLPVRRRRGRRRPAGVAAPADDDALANSPPTLVITAELDPLRDEGEAYAARLRTLGVGAATTRYDGMFHGFVSFGEFLDDGRRAVAEASAALAGALEAPTLAV